MAGIETIKLTAGQPVFREGDNPDALYFVVSGTLKVTRKHNGVDTELATLGADAVFGEMALIDNQPRSATVVAAEDAECLKATEPNFAAVLKKSDPMVQATLKELTTLIREKNVAGNNPPPALQQKIAIFKKNSQGNIGLQQKIRASEPLIGNVYQALLSYIA